MKKLVRVLALTALLVVTMIGIAQAEENGIQETFFPDGTISTPSAPYVLYTDKYDEGEDMIGSTWMYFDVPEDLLKLNAEYATLGAEAFNEKYNTPMRYDYHESLTSNLQIDVKFDDGPWLSESGDWDHLNYGESIDGSNLNFRVDVGRYIDETSKLFCFEQSWLVYNEPEAEKNAFLQPYLKTFTDENGELCYQFDMENHTFSYRFRFVVSTENWEAFDEGEEVFWCLSDWSPVVSIGKEGKQEALEKPTKVDAPVLSKFSLIKNEDNGVEAQYYVDFTKYTYDSIKYFSIVEDYFEPFVIESQIRVDDGEWVDTYTANAASLSGGYRSTTSGDVEITMDSQVEIRVRIVCNAMDGTASEWSNIVGNKAEAEITPEPTATPEPEITNTPTPTPTPTVEPKEETEKQKCKVCGICPIQPLGICLFIWLVIIIVVVVIVIIVLKKMKNEDKNNKKEQ